MMRNSVLLPLPFTPVTATTPGPSNENSSRSTPVARRP
jgi:hypothetical protein